MLSDPSRLIAALARDRINLELRTLDLCFLAGLYLRADRASLASFENADLDIETLVERALATGARSLAEVTEWVLPNFPAHLHYAVTGRVADALARVTRARSACERPWRTVARNLELEDWDMPRERELR